MIGENGIGIIRKIFGVVLLAISIKLFTTNIKLLLLICLIHNLFLTNCIIIWHKSCTFISKIKQYEYYKNI